MHLTTQTEHIRHQQMETLGAADLLATVFLKSSKFCQEKAWETCEGKRLGSPVGGG